MIWVQASRHQDGLVMSGLGVQNINIMVRRSIFRSDWTMILGRENRTRTDSEIGNRPVVWGRIGHGSKTLDELHRFGDSIEQSGSLLNS